MSTRAGGTVGPATASGDGHNDSGNNNDQSAVRDSAAGTNEEDEKEEDVDGDDDDDDDADDGKGKGKGKGMKRPQAAVAADDREDPCPICQDDLPEMERGILKCVSGVVLKCASSVVRDVSMCFLLPLVRGYLVYQRVFILMLVLSYWSTICSICSIRSICSSSNARVRSLVVCGIGIFLLPLLSRTRYVPTSIFSVSPPVFSFFRYMYEYVVFEYLQ